MAETNDGLLRAAFIRLRLSAVGFQSPQAALESPLYGPLLRNQVTSMERRLQSGTFSHHSRPTKAQTNQLPLL